MSNIDNEMREAYIGAAVSTYRDVFVPSIKDLDMRAVAAATPDEKIRKAAGEAYDKMMGKKLPEEKVTVPGPEGGPNMHTAALANVPEHERHLHGGRSVITQRGPDLDYRGRIIENAVEMETRGNSSGNYR